MSTIRDKHLVAILRGNRYRGVKPIELDPHGDRRTGIAIASPRTLADRLALGVGAAFIGFDRVGRIAYQLGELFTRDFQDVDPPPHCLDVFGRVDARSFFRHHSFRTAPGTPGAPGRRLRLFCRHGLSTPLGWKNGPGSLPGPRSFNAACADAAGWPCDRRTCRHAIAGAKAWRARARVAGCKRPPSPTHPRRTRP